MLFNKYVLSSVTATTVEMDKFLSSQKVPLCHLFPFLGCNVQILSFPIRDQTHAPCTGCSECQLLDCQGNPSHVTLISFLFPS